MERAEVLRTLVPPVLHEPVQVLEVPPRNGGSGKQRNELARRAGEDRSAGAAENEPVHHEDVSEPEREKHVVLRGAKPREPAPRATPGDEIES